MTTHRSGGTSVRAALVRVGCRVLVRPTLAHFPLWRPLLRLLPLIDVLCRAFPHPRTVEWQRIKGDTWEADLVCPVGKTDPRGAVVYFHGGAFLFGGLASYRRIVSRLSENTGLPVLSVGYRKLPRAVLDDSIQDGISAFDWLTALGIEPGSVVLAGDSAGGHLAFATALELQRRGYDRPAGIVGLSAWLDFDPTDKLAHPNARRDVAIPAARLERVARLCLGGEEVDPARSPVNADLRGLPPVLLHCAEDEVLRHDSEVMAKRLASAGVPHQLHVWPGMIHAFPILGKLLPESRAVLSEVSAFVVEAATRPRQQEEPVLSDLAARLLSARAETAPLPVPPPTRVDPFPPVPTAPRRVASGRRAAVPGQRRSSRLEGIVVYETGYHRGQRRENVNPSP
jgi:acetyl esterase/lipase